MAVRISQEVVETLVQPAGRQARVSQAVVEALIGPAGVQARVSQVVVEVLCQDTPPASPRPLTPAVASARVPVVGLLTRSFLVSMPRNVGVPVTLIDPHLRIGVYLPWYPTPYLF